MEAFKNLNSPVAKRLVDEHLRELLHAPNSHLNVVVLLGPAGNGVRTLIRERIPQLLSLSKPQFLTGSWPTEGSLPVKQFFAVKGSRPAEDSGPESEGAKTVLLSETPAGIPAFPPPQSSHGACIVVGCHRLETLPEWIRSLPEKSRTIIEVDTLSHAELQDFCAARLGGLVTSSAIREIGGICGFVPAQVASLMRVLKREGVLMQVDGTWTLISPIETRFFVSTLRNALASFDAQTVELFLRLCLVGVEERETLSNGNQDRLRELELAGFVTVAADGRGEVRSRLLIEVGQQLADPVRSSEIYMRALKQPKPPEQVILWALQHRHRVAPEAVENVLQHLLSVHEWRAALRLASSALEALEEAPNDNPKYACELLLAQAFALRFLDDPDEALAVLNDAEHLAASLTETNDLYIRAIVHTAEILHYKLGNVTAALDALRNAHAKSSPQFRGSIAGHHKLHLLYAGRFREAAAPDSLGANDLTAIPRDLRTRIAIAECLALVAQGRIRKAFMRAVQIGARHLLSRSREAWITEELSAAYFVSSFRKNGPAQLPGLMNQFEGKGARSYRPDDTTFQLVRTTWLLATGKLVEAERESVTCYANMQFHDPSGLSRSVAALRAQIVALCGDSYTARAMIAEAERLPPRSGAVVAGGAATHLSAARYLLGDANASAKTLAAAEAFIADGYYGFAAEVLYAGVRFGDLVAAAALINISNKVDGSLVELHVAHARAVHDSDPVALIRAGDALLRAGLLLNAFEAYGLVAHLAETARVAVPRVTLKRAKFETEKLAEKIGIIAHPFHIDRAKNAAVTLTPREREVQQLILAGLTNREIAARLSLSIRTVEGHVSRLYRKTGEERRDPGRRSPETAGPDSHI